ncbi:MAG: hypothetical protein ACI814_003832 [Mariniblastus sp.]|jgi:hypothetical protein
MFSNSTRILIFIVALTYSVYELVTGTGMGYVAIAAALWLAAGYIRYGPIRPAFIALYQGKFDRARRLAESIKFPSLLSQQSQAYFHWIHGVLAFNDGDYLNADIRMRQAIAGNLRTSNDKCIAIATLAQIVAKNGQLDEANQILDDAILIPHKDETGAFLSSTRNEIRNTP